MMAAYTTLYYTFSRHVVRYVKRAAYNGDCSRFDDGFVDIANMIAMQRCRYWKGILTLPPSHVFSL